MAMFLAGGTSLDQINHTLRLIQQHFAQQNGTVQTPPSVAATQGAFSIVGGGGSAGGTVTSVGLALPGEFAVGGSPITTGGTFSVTWSQENPNTVFAGPLGAVAGTPGFRKLDQTDMPISVWSNRYQIPTGESLTVPKYATLLGGVGGLIVDGTLIVEGQTLAPWNG